MRLLGRSPRSLHPGPVPVRVLTVDFRPVGRQLVYRLALPTCGRPDVSEALRERHPRPVHHGDEQTRSIDVTEVRIRLWLLYHTGGSAAVSVF